VANRETTAETLNRLRATLQAEQQALETAQAELDELDDDLRAFEFEFEANMGQLLAELAALEAEIADYLAQVKQKRTESRFGHGYQSVEDQFVNKWNPNPKAEEPKIRINTKPPPKQTIAASDVQIKKLYRQLARHFHPDLALDEADRLYRTEKMAAINEAYAAKSMAELMAMAQAMNRDDLWLAAQETQQTADQLIEALQTEITRTRKQLAWVENELRNFHNRTMVELALEVKLAQRNGRNLLQEMATELQKKLARKQVERDMIWAQMKGMS
jgi:hypothetical protein